MNPERVFRGDEPAAAHEVRASNRLKLAAQSYVIASFEHGSSVKTATLLMRRLYCRH